MSVEPGKQDVLRLHSFSLPLAAEQLNEDSFPVLSSRQIHFPPVQTPVPAEPPEIPVPAPPLVEVLPVVAPLPPADVPLEGGVEVKIGGFGAVVPAGVVVDFGLIVISGGLSSSGNLLVGIASGLWVLTAGGLAGARVFAGVRDGFGIFVGYKIVLQ